MPVLTVANFKGGTGKTTNTFMLAKLLAERGFKTLVIDKDPQANATTVFMRTANNERGFKPKPEKYLFDGLQAGDLSICITNISENLDLIPNQPSFYRYPKWLELQFPTSEINFKRRMMYFDHLLNPIKEEYDFIFIDVPPTFSVLTDAALYASDHVIIVLQTQDLSLDGADVFLEYLHYLTAEYELDLDVLGILYVTYNKKSQIDQRIIRLAEKEYGGKYNIFNTHITHLERLKGYVPKGISKEKLDMHDKHVRQLFDQLIDEILDALNTKEEGLEVIIDG